MAQKTTTPEKKKLLFICQAKGGSGKSVLTWLIAEKHRNARLVDMDDGTRTTMKQLAYRDPVFVSFQNENKTIDRGLFNDFLDRITESEHNLIVCDLGASLSEQLPKYIHETGAEALQDLLTDVNVDLQLICVVGGANIFKSCMEYLDELATAVDGKLNLQVAINNLYVMDEVQKEDFANFMATPLMKIATHFTFDVSGDKNLSTQSKINSVLKAGNGLTEVKPTVKLLFAKSLSTLSI